MKELRIIPPWDVFLFWIRHCCETRFENLLRIIGCSNRAEYKHFLFILCSFATCCVKVVNEAFELKVDTREPGSSLGTGGMSTKIAAARTAHCAGILEV